MKVYVESNFVLELALLQEQWESCEEMLKLCEAERAHLIVPAYCLAEPYETLTRRQRNRKRMGREVSLELDQLDRTKTYAGQLGGFRELTDFLIESAEGEDKRLEGVSSRLLHMAEVIPLNANVLESATGYRSRHGFSPQDSIVYASVLSHVENQHGQASCFLNRDTDFDDDDVVEELRGRGCQLLPGFDVGYRFLVENVG